MPTSYFLLLPFTTMASSSSLSSCSRRFHAYFRDVYLPVLQAAPSSSARLLQHQHLLDKLGNCLLDFFVSSPDDSCCQQAALKVLAVDFDLTMTNKHSGGVLDLASSSSFLSSAICPAFTHFAQLAQNRGLKICVVTFSDSKLAASNTHKDGKRRKWIGGEELVRAAVQQSCSLQKTGGGELNIDKVFGFLPSYYQHQPVYQALGLTAPMSADKSFHLSCVYNHYGLSSPTEVLYIDDDLNNCRTAAVHNEQASCAAAAVRPEDMVGVFPYVLHVGGGEGFMYDVVRPL
eukprot:GHVS01037129.1.p1 GENE.GHVS01037129.1~~GHVS01037129.1.p1  ORF type:complete len:289 (-),score=80.89 GHVS01037129.1:444-1310(-)